MKPIRPLILLAPAFAAAALAAALLAGPMVLRARAQGPAPTGTGQQAVVTQVAGADKEATAQEAVPEAKDADTVDQQVSEQVGGTTADPANAAAETGEKEVSEAAAEAADPAPAGTPAITADAAKAAAEASLNASGKATTVTLDDENGKLVYSVQIGQTDVKVDANTGTVLPAQASEVQESN